MIDYDNFDLFMVEMFLNFVLELFWFVILIDIGEDKWFRVV